MIDIRRHRRGLMIAYLIGLIPLTLAPVPAVPGGLPGLDKLVHIALFGGLAIVLYWNLRAGLWASLRPHLVIAVVLTAALAGLIEVLQALLPYRSGDVVDLLVGAVSGFLGAGMGWAAMRARGGDTTQSEI